MGPTAAAGAEAGEAAGGKTSASSAATTAQRPRTLLGCSSGIIAGASQNPPPSAGVIGGHLPLWLPERRLHRPRRPIRLQGIEGRGCGQVQGSHALGDGGGRERRRRRRAQAQAACSSRLRSRPQACLAQVLVQPAGHRPRAAPHNLACGARRSMHRARWLGSRGAGSSASGSRAVLQRQSRCDAQERRGAVAHPCARTPAAGHP